MTIKSMSALHDLVLCLAEMISYMPDLVVSWLQLTSKLSEILSLNANNS